MVENKIEIMPFLYNAAPIPGHLLTRRNLATILVQCRCHSWTFTNKTKIDYFFWKCNCSGFTSHCTGIDHTLPRTRCSYSSGEPPLSGQVQYACRETRCYGMIIFRVQGFPKSLRCEIDQKSRSPNCLHGDTDILLFRSMI